MRGSAACPLFYICTPIYRKIERMITPSLLHKRLLTAISLGFVLMVFAGFLSAQEAEPNTPSITVLIEGLHNPLGMALAGDGTLFIAEEGTGMDDLSAGVSIRQPDGTIGRYISGLPSGRDSGDLSGVALVQISPDGETLYVGNFGAGHLWAMPLTLPIELPETPYTPDDLGIAMQPLNRVALLNPFAMTFDPLGIPVVSDASNNGVAKENTDGTTRFIHRFDPLIDPENERLTIDPVPTGIERVGEEYYVTLFGGCPYPANSGELVAIDEQRQQRTVVDNLNMPIDVAVGSDGTIWVLEFATFSADGSCFSGSGYQQNTGTLSRLRPDGTLEAVVRNLNFPGAILPLPDGSLYVTEIFDGEVLHIRFDGETASQPLITPQTGTLVAQYNDIVDADSTLRDVIAAQGLQPYPGREWLEGDTALARLGQDLFFDPILSGDQNISCATCHHPALAMADGRVLPIGTGGFGLGSDRDFVTHITVSAEIRDGEPGETANPFNGSFVPRNSPTIINSALLPVQFWDGRVETYALGDVVHTQEEGVNLLLLDDILLVQALFPITSREEMAGATFTDEPPAHIRRILVSRLEADPIYNARFEQIFGAEIITPVQVVTALAAFERRFIFTSSRWDAYIAGDQAALTDQEKRGALLFYGALNQQVNCAICHSGDLFTDLDYHNLLVPQVGPGKGDGIDNREDWGRARVTYDWRDRYAFRTPGLRNIELTAPYFHSGAFPTLESVIWHHANIWQSATNYDPSAYLPQDFQSGLRPYNFERQSQTVTPLLANGLPLTQQDVADIVAFLQSLTDPNARDLIAFVPENVPSGLALDPLPSTSAEMTVDTSVPAVSVSSETRDEAPQQNDWRFRNVTEEVGLDFQHGAFVTGLSEDPAAMMGAGLCWIDYDNDGWLDLYLVNSYAEEEIDYWEANRGLPRNALFRNEGGTFREVSAETGTDLSMRGNGCVAADFNLDGWMDLHITADGVNALLWNNGDGTFSEGAAQAGIASPEWNSAAAVADINHDGWPDLFVGSYIDLEYTVPRPVGAFPQDYYGLPDRFYISNGLDENGRVTFREVTREAGLFRDERALGAVFSDFDNDGDLDLYIANDGQANRLYENQPLDDDPLGIGFRFIDTHETANVGDTGSGMGVASADWDGDGYFDLMVTNWEAELNAIYRNLTPETGYLNFLYSTYRIGMRGLGNNMTGWGTALVDFDHDSDLDLLTVNGRVPITNLETDPELVQLYVNRTADGTPGQFLPWTNLVGLCEVGSLLARGSAVADYDNDGDLDIAINTIAGNAILLENENTAGNWLIVSPEGFNPGTIVEVTLDDGRILHREIHAGSSYLASEDPRLHFGLGDNSVTTIRVTWPDGGTSTTQMHYSNKFVVVTRTSR